MSKHALVAVIAGSTLALTVLTACGEDPGTKGDATSVTALQTMPPSMPPSASASMPPGLPPGAPSSAPPAKPKPKPKKPKDAHKNLQHKIDALVKKNPVAFDPSTAQLTPEGLQTVSKIADAMGSGDAKLQVTTTASAKTAKAAKKKSLARMKSIVDELTADGLDQSRIQTDAASTTKKAKTSVEFKVG